VTGAETLAELDEELAAQGIALAIARANREVRLMLERSGVAERLGARCQFPTVRVCAHGFASRANGGPS